MILFIILIAGISNLTLGSLVLYKMPRSKTARMFFLFTVAASAWIFTNFFWRLTYDYPWLKATYATGVAFVLFGLLWTHSLTAIKIPAWYYTLAFFGIAFFAASLADNLVVLRPELRADANAIIFSDYAAFGQGILFNSLSVFMLIAMLLTLFRLYQGFRQSRGLQKVQIKYVFISGIFFITLVFVFDFFLPSFFHNFTFAFVDSPLSLLLIAVFTYTTLRFRLMNVQVLIRKGFVYVALGIFSYAAFHFVAWFLFAAFGSLWTLAPLTFGLIIALFFAFSFRYAYRFAIYFANRYLYANIYNAEETFRNLTDRLVAIVDLGTLAQTIADAITNTFTVKKIAVALTRGGVRIMARRAFTVSDVRAFKSALPFLKSVSLVFTAERTNAGDKRGGQASEKPSALADFFAATGAQLIIPLRVKGESVGIIVVGAKKADRAFTRDDLTLLDTLGKQASIAVDNAFLYQDLAKKNARLKDMLTLQQEFLDIASHQLRTPISIMRGATSLLTSQNDVLTLPEAVPLIYDAAVRMNGIVDTMLLASKVGGARFRVQKQWLKPIALAPLIDTIMHGFRYSIKNKNIEVSVLCPKDALILAYDRYVEIVLVNLVENALKYSGVSQLPKVQILVEKNGKAMRIRVIDNGIGVPDRDKEKLFNKFVRGANVLKKFPDGTGLGLFIIKKIVKAHPLGRTGLISALNKGSEFWVEFKAA